MTTASEARKARKAMEETVVNSKPIAVKDEKEQWSDYQLEDDTKLRIKPLVMEVRKSNKKGPDGN